jgi:hypothetical protein
MLIMVGQPVSEGRLDAMMNECDYNRDGSLQFEVRVGPPPRGLGSWADHDPLTR